MRVRGEGRSSVPRYRLVWTVPWKSKKIEMTTEKMRRERQGFTYRTFEEPEPLFVVKRVNRKEAVIVDEGGQVYSLPMPVAEAMRMVREIGAE